MKTTVIVLLFLVLFVCSMNGVEAQASSLNLLFFNGPGSVNVGQTFQVSVGVQYFFASPTEIAVDIYEHGGPLLTNVHATVSGTGTQTFTLQMTAPWTPRTWRLNAHGVYLEGGTWKQSSPQLLSLFVSVVGATPTTTTTPPPPPSTFDFSISASVSYQSVQAGQSASYSLTINLISGSPQTVSLDVSGVPSGASGSFSPSSGQPTFSSSLVVTTADSTPAGTYSLAVNCRGGGQFHTISLTLVVVPSGQPPPQTVTVQPPPQTVTVQPPQTVTVQPPPQPQTDLTPIALAIVAAAVIIAAVVFLVRRH